MNLTKEQIDILKESIANAWDTKRGLLLFLGVILFASFFVFNAIDIQKIDTDERFITGGFLVFGFFFWYFTRIKKPSKGRIGIGVAIHREDSEEAKKLHKDFILSLRKAFLASEQAHRFQVIDYPPSVSEKIVGVQNAKDFANKAKLNFFLFGNTRIRDTYSGPVHFIDNNGGIVRHAVVPMKSSKELGDEFSKVLANFMIKTEENIAGCDFAAEHISSVTKYIVGITYAFSKDFQQAERLFLDVENALRKKLEGGDGNNVIANLYERIRVHLKTFYSFWLKTLANEFARTRNPEILLSLEQIIEKSKIYESDNINISYSEAICAFKLRRDLKAVKQSLARSKNFKDPAWLLNMAFVLAYEGKLESAHKHYSKAFKLPIADKTLFSQCEQFMQ